MAGPRVIAEFSDYTGFINALRKRAAELKIAISAEENTDLAGLPSGYIAKLIGVRPVKRIGARSFGPILGAFGLKCIMVEDVEALERMRMMGARYGRKLKTRNQSLVRGVATHNVVTRRFLRKIGHKGAVARVENTTPWQRLEWARKAAMVRWRGRPKMVRI